METQMAGSISRLDGNMSQDAVFKDILAYKEVLAHIMKTCVVEYRDCTIPEIMSYIENEPEVGQSGGPSGRDKSAKDPRAGHGKQQHNRSSGGLRCAIFRRCPR